MTATASPTTPFRSSPLWAASFATVCVESKDDDAVREALSNLSFVELGPPRNYMEILHGYE
jgi:hypothetical protein